MSGQFQFVATQDHNSTGKGAYFKISLTPDNSVTVTERLRLQSNGSLLINALASTYTGGSAYLCVDNSGTIFASESACP